VTAGLAQIGEFSFILAGLGVALGLLPPEGRDLILAGALLSIMLNPLLFAALGHAMRWLEERPGLRSRLERPRERGSAFLAALAEGGRQGGLRDHAVLVGFGRVGSAIGRALATWELPYVVVDRDRWRVEELRGRADAPPVVFGDAAAPGILSAAGVERARLLIIATPDGYQARRILQIARAANPGIDTLVRTHSEEELHFLESQNVGLAILSEQELALGMMGYALRSMGLSQGEANLYVQSSRRTDDAGLEILETAPELRPHREPEDAEAGGHADPNPA